MDAAIVFNQITPERFDTICAKAQQQTGIAIHGLQGVAQGASTLGKVEIEWTYDPEAQLLTIQCLKRPWGTGDLVAGRLRSLVELS